MGKKSLNNTNPTEIKSKEEIEAENQKYKEKIDKLKRSHKITHSITGFVRTVITILIIVSLGISFMSNRAKCHTPVTSDMISIEQYELNDTYDTSTVKTEIIDGTNYVTIKIGDYTKKVPLLEANGVSENNKITTSIYVVEATLKEPYFLSFINSKSVMFVRFSCLGESNFSESDIENLKTEAANYFTYEKYRLFFYEDRTEEPSYIEDFAGGKHIVSTLLQIN